MKTSKYITQILILITGFTFYSCEDFLDVEAPDQKIVSEVVFNDDKTAVSVMTGIYNQLFSSSFSGGWEDSITVLAGLSSDELATRTNNLTMMEFDENEILPDNPRNLNVWSSAYNVIYMANALLEGLEGPNGVTEDTRTMLEGEAKFIRAFTYFYLVNLYGDVPLLLTTDYRLNALAGRTSHEEVYELIVEDLNSSIGLLGNQYPLGDRTRVNRSAAIALLARVHLYLENWEEAENLSTQVIAQSGTYRLLEELDDVFLANSEEALWQISPMGGGNVTTHTNEGSVFIIDPLFSFFSHLKLQDDFHDLFMEQDERLAHWVSYHEGLSVHYPFKYKIENSTAEVTEYSMVLRLAEQYLIRAEARAMQEDFLGSISDIDVLRIRAGLNPVAEINFSIGKEPLLELIMDERKRELFAEWGHRWLDLKRTGRAEETLGTNSQLWENSDVLFPIPEEERMKNPNLTQNPGY